MTKPIDIHTKLSNDEIASARKKHFLPTAGHYHKTPLQLTKAQGAFVWDNEGKKYLDSIGGIVCISAGHNHPKIKKALIAMIESDDIQHSSTLYFNRHPVKLAEKLSKHLPEKLSRYHFTNSGSEANEAAMMAARHATGENMVVNLRHSYHGGTSATLASCGHHTWRFRSQPVTNVTSAMEPYCYRCPFNKTESNCELECAKNVETTIQTSTHGKIAAFIAEPVMGVGGFITPQKEYFQEVSKIVKNYGGKYISDEVQTGSGRCGGSLFLSTELGIDADIITTAKGMGHGAAIGGAFMTRKYLMDGLKELMKSHPLIGDVRGRGLLMGIELVKDRTTKEHAIQETIDVMDLCREKGLLLGKGGLRGNVLRIAPALTITRTEVDFMIKVIDECLHQVAKK
jgi:alanine-glyoxylate transaminase/(R)-3-amino-2-methylpropionate-pyruvate transaminase